MTSSRASTPLVLCTGGCGFIGSHTCVALLAQGYEVAVVDNFSNSARDTPARIARADLCDQEKIRDVFDACQSLGGVKAVIHFAGVKAAGESVEKPLMYYQINIESTVNLLAVMGEFGCTKIVFSSSATVYGEPEFLPITESHRVSPLNPYGHTKALIEQMIRDVAHAGNLRGVLLRYFNPIGAHPSSVLGENPNGIATNLMPVLCDVLRGKRSEVSIFGDDYDTADGTGVRDYIHVVDLADAHVAAVEALFHDRIPSCEVFNVGTGTGVSVLGLIQALEKVSGRSIPRRVAPRRPGDASSVFADATRIQERLGFRATHDVEDMCRDTWRYVEAMISEQSKNVA